MTGFNGPVPAPLDFGQEYVATFTFDSDAIATPTSGGGSDYIGAIQSASFSIGSYHGTLASPAQTTIWVADSYFGTTDRYDVYLGDSDLALPGVIDAPPLTTPAGDLFPAFFVLIALWDYFPALDGLASDALPLVPPDLAKFFIGGWAVDFYRQGDDVPYTSAQGSIQSFTLVQQVPEPPTLLLFAMSLGALLAVAARRRGLPVLAVYFSRPV